MGEYHNTEYESVTWHYGNLLIVSSFSDTPVNALWTQKRNVSKRKKRRDEHAMMNVYIKGT
jgi:hypothetical protein